MGLWSEPNAEVVEMSKFKLIFRIRKISNTSGLSAPKWVGSAGPRTLYLFLSEWRHRMRPLGLVIFEFQAECLAFRSPPRIILQLEESWKIVSKSEARRFGIVSWDNWNFELSIKVTSLLHFQNFRSKNYLYVCVLWRFW